MTTCSACPASYHQADSLVLMNLGVPPFFAYVLNV